MKNIFLKELKTYIGTLILTFLFFVIFKLIIPILKLINKIKYESNIESLISFSKDLLLNNIFDKFIIILLAIIIAINIFSYLYNKDKVEYYNNLNIKKSTLFLIKYFLGIFIIFSVIVVSNLILYIILYKQLKSSSINFLLLLKRIAFDILFFISVYSITIFSCILSGNRIVAFLSNLFIINFQLLIIFICNLLVYNFLDIIDISYLLDYQEMYNPVLCYFSLYNIEDFKLNIFVTHSMLIVIMYLINLFLFKIRKEQISKVCIIFGFAKTIIKYLVIFIFSILFSFIFYIILNSTSVLYIGIIFWSIVFHCIIEISYSFSIKGIFNNKKGILISIFVNCLFVSIFQFDLLNRIEYVPKINSIKSISINNINLLEEDYYNEYINNKDIIKNILKLHKILIEESNVEREYSGEQYDIFTIKYKLNNNLILSREFSLYYNDKTTPMIKNIINNKLYIEDIFSQLIWENVPNYEVSIYDNAYNEYINKKELDIKLLFEYLKKDIEKNGLYVPSKESVFSLYFYDYEGYYLYTININKKFTNTLNYLQTLNITPKNINIDLIDYITVINLVDYEEENFEIRNKIEMEKILNNYVVENLLSSRGDSEMPITVRFDFKDGTYNFGRIDKNLYLELKQSNKG